MTPYAVVYRCDLCAIVKRGARSARLNHGGDLALPHTNFLAESVPFPYWTEDERERDPAREAMAEGWRELSIEEGDGRARCVVVCPTHHKALLVTFGLPPEAPPIDAGEDDA